MDRTYLNGEILNAKLALTVIGESYVSSLKKGKKSGYLNLIKEIEALINSLESYIISTETPISESCLTDQEIENILIKIRSLTACPGVESNFLDQEDGFEILQEGDGRLIWE